MAEPTIQRLNEILERARRRGAQRVEALYRSARGWDLRVERGKVTHRARVEEDTLTVRVWTAAGGGRAAGRMLGAEAVIGAALAAVKPVDELDGPVPRIQPLEGGLAIEDRRWSALEEGDRVEVLVDAERALRAGERFSVEPVAWSDRAAYRAFASTAGMSGSERSNLYRVGAACALPDGLTLHGELSTRTFASIASLPFGVDLARRATALMAPRMELPAGPIRVLFGSPVTARLLDQLARLCVPWVAGRSFLSGVVLDPRVHLVDDPLLAGGLRTRGFDDRGVPPMPLTLLKEGQLHARYLDPIGAARSEIRPSGHVWEDELGPSNLILRHGTRSVHVILADIGGRTFAPDDMPDWSGLDPATGRFAATVNGTVYEGSRAVGSAVGVRLEADLATVLSSLVEISGETDRIGHVDAPAIVLDGFSVV